MKFKKLKGKLILGWLLIVCPVFLTANSQEAIESNDITIGKYHKIDSKILSEERTISVYLPIEYNNNDNGYPVMYVLDGAMVTRLMTTASTMEFMDGQGRIPQMIIIGIDAPNSLRDYFPTELEGRPGSGKADNFIKFISEELIPWVDSNYHTVPFNILCGASNSGLFTVYTYLTEKDLFSAYIAASPSIGWSKEFILEKITEKFKADNETGPAIYMNYATDDIESIVLSAMPDFTNSLKENIPDNLRWKLEILENAGHVPFVSFLNGLGFIFPDWKYPQDSLKTGGLAGLRNHSRFLEEKYRFPAKIPSGDLMDLGYDYFSEERWQEAIDVFKEYTIEYPFSPRAHYFLGETFSRNGDIDLAIVYFEKTLEISPDYARAQQKLEQIQSSSN